MIYFSEVMDFLHSLNNCSRATRTYAKSDRQTAEREWRVKNGIRYLVLVLGNGKN